MCQNIEYRNIYTSVLEISDHYRHTDMCMSALPNFYQHTYCIVSCYVCVSIHVC